MAGFGPPARARAFELDKEYRPVIATLTVGLLTGLGSLPTAMGGNDLTRQRNWEGFVVNTRKKLAEAALQVRKRLRAMRQNELPE